MMQEGMGVYGASSLVSKHAPQLTKEQAVNALQGRIDELARNQSILIEARDLIAEIHMSPALMQRFLDVMWR